MNDSTQKEEFKLNGEEIIAKVKELSGIDVPGLDDAIVIPTK
jgi:hypothetical protein